jgi:hypothetical protein
MAEATWVRPGVARRSGRPIRVEVRVFHGLHSPAAHRFFVPFGARGGRRHAVLSWRGIKVIYPSYLSAAMSKPAGRHLINQAESTFIDEGRRGSAQITRAPRQGMLSILGV